MTATRFAWASRTRWSRPSARRAGPATCKRDQRAAAGSAASTAFQGGTGVMAVLPRERSFAQFGISEVDMVPKIEEATGGDDDAQLFDAFNVEGELLASVLTSNRGREKFL